MTQSNNRPARLAWCIASAAALLLASPASQALDTERDDIRAFVNQLVSEHGFEAEFVESVLDQSKKKQKILDAISRPAERTLTWKEYRNIFITPKRIDAGVAFFAEYGDRLARIEANTGVPAEIVAAIVGVETFYGSITGSYRVVDALATLGFEYPPRQKFFRGELEEFFLLAREEGLDINAIEGSYAGAMGPPQFIPSSYRAYAVDGDGDGQRNLLSNWDDILASVANYFVAHKWQAGKPIAAPGRLDGVEKAPNPDNSLKLSETVGSIRNQGIAFDTSLEDEAAAQVFTLEGANGEEIWVGFDNFYVITRYNRSVLYAMAVQELAAELKRATSAPATAHLGAH